MLLWDTGSHIDGEITGGGAPLNIQAGPHAGLREAPADQPAQALGRGECVGHSSRAQGGWAGGGWVVEARRTLLDALR